jgi:putative phosphoribosyl transferase
MLNEVKLATLLIDLLTAEEEAIDRRTAHLPTRRAAGRGDGLAHAVHRQRHLPIGYFGASAAAALVAAAES